MKKNRFGAKAAAALLAVLLLLPQLISCADDLIEKTPTALVMLAVDDGIQVNGDNPVRVPVGEDAVFDVTLADNLAIDTMTGGEASYADGKITVSGVRTPTTVNVTSREKEQFLFFKSEDVRSDITEGRYYEGTVIHLTTASDKDGLVFMGYTNGKTMQSGGEVLSYDRNAEIVLTKNITVYANYVTEGQRMIVYDANGGATTGGSDKLYLEVKDMEGIYLCPNALENMDYFVRDGYVVAGYNTEPDGSGRYYGCGWNVVMPETGWTTLYVQWMKVTDPADFTYQVKGSRITINEYTGDDETVVIPETIEGLPVSVLMKNTFNGKKMKTLYVTKNVMNLMDGAVTDCPQLRELYLSDKISAMSNKAFTDCPELSTVYLQACQHPKYMTSRNGNYQVKYERLITADHPKLVITAGSNCAYGVDSPMLEELLDHKYNVVNYGCNQSTPCTFYMEVAAYWMKEGDILVHAPEEFSNYQFGYNEINETLWQIFEGAYGAFSCVDLRHYVNFFSSFAAFNNSRASRGNQTYEQYSSETVNIYGDYCKLKVGTSYTPSYNSKTYQPKTVTQYKDNLNEAFGWLHDKGVKIYMSYAVINRVSLTDQGRDPAVQAAFMKAVEDNLEMDAVISVVEDYIMDAKYVFNSDHHVNTEGCKIRTQRLADDILAQFDREKK